MKSTHGILVIILLFIILGFVPFITGLIWGVLMGVKVFTFLAFWTSLVCFIETVRK